MPDFTGLVKKTDYEAEILHIEGKYFTIFIYNKFTSDILDARLKQKELVKKSDISNLVKISDLHTNFTKATKAELKAEQNKIIELQAFDSTYFLFFFFLLMILKICMFITLELKKARTLNILLVRYIKVCLNLNFFHYMVFVYPTKKHFWYKIGIQFNSTPFLVP